MSIIITALGIGCIGCVFGYVLLFTLKRYLPPISKQPSSLKDVSMFLATLGLGGSFGLSLTDIEGTNYLGPYGLGLLVGLAANVAFTIAVELLVWRSTPDD